MPIPTYMDKWQSPCSSNRYAIDFYNPSGAAISSPAFTSPFLQDPNVFQRRKIKLIIEMNTKTRTSIGFVEKSKHLVPKGARSVVI